MMSDERKRPKQKSDIKVAAPNSNRQEADRSMIGEEKNS